MAAPAPGQPGGPPPLIAAGLQGRVPELAWLNTALQDWWTAFSAGQSQQQASSSAAEAVQNSEIEALESSVSALQTAIAGISSAPPSPRAPLTVPFTSLSTWDYVHGLGYEPIVQVTDLSGNILDCNPTHVSVNEVRLNLSAALSGFLVLSPPNP